MEIIYSDTFFKRFKGLIGKKGFDHIMVFTNLTDSSIHTMFMRFEIDIYFVDKNGVIFDKVTLRPWNFYKPKKQAKYIIETEKNKLNLKIGDKLDFL